MRIPALLLLLALTACSLGSHSERTLYKLSADAVLPPQHDAGRGKPVLELPALTAEPDLDNDAIEVETGGRISEVDGAAWAAPLPEMITPLVTGTLERSGHYASVVGEESDVTAARRLQLNIERFTLVLGKAPHVEVAIRAEMTDQVNGKLLKSALLSAEEPIEAVRMHFVIPAFERAFAACLRDLTGTFK